MIDHLLLDCPSSFDGGWSWGLSCLEPHWEACVPVTTDSAQLDKPGPVRVSAACGSSQGFTVAACFVAYR